MFRRTRPGISQDAIIVITERDRGQYACRNMMPSSPARRQVARFTNNSQHKNNEEMVQDANVGLLVLGVLRPGNIYAPFRMGTDL